jgi:hypothetical protein
VTRQLQTNSAIVLNSDRQSLLPVNPRIFDDVIMMIHQSVCGDTGPVHCFSSLFGLAALGGPKERL